MTVQFSRSTRSLKHDRGFAGYVILISATAVIAAWLAWFFFAPVTLYETSTQFTIRRDGLLLVSFPEAALTRIVPGQTAIFSPAISANEFGSSLPALVMDTPASTGRRDGLVHVYLHIPTQPTANLTGEVKIAVEEVSPFTLILRSRR